MFKSKINQRIDRLVERAKNTSRKRDLDRLFTDFYRDISHLTKEEVKAVIDRIIADILAMYLKEAKKLGLVGRELEKYMAAAKQKTIRISHLRNFIASRYHKGKLIDDDIDIIASFNNMPRKLTDRMKQRINAFHASDKLNIDVRDIKKITDRQWKVLVRTAIAKAKQDALFEMFPDDKAIMYVSVDDEKRDDVCGRLHGNVWLKKSDIKKYERPPTHFNCRCSLKLVSDTGAVKKTTKGVKQGRKCVPPAWLKSNDKYSNIKKIKGVCEWEYFSLE